MQLKKVYTNKDSFKTIEFNSTGLNFIVAKQEEPNSSDTGKTYNGVGKSLLITIIHFCLGSNVNRKFCEKLNDWEFSLDFIIGGQDYTSRRCTNQPNCIFFNEQKYKIKDFNQEMKSLCFNIPDDAKYLSFRTLLPFFIRPSKSSYASYLEVIDKATPFQTLLYNSFLLGLDVGLVQSKETIKKKIDELKKFMNLFGTDSSLKKFVTGERDAELSIVELTEKIEHLDEQLSNYRVAENYYEIQKKADSLEKKRFDIDNEIFLCQNHIKQIEKSLLLSPDIDKEHIEKIYKEAKIIFSEQIKNKLTDIKKFHEGLIQNRKIRLIEQKSKLSRDIEEKTLTSQQLKKELDKLMKYLGDHGALDTFRSLAEQNNELKIQRDKLLHYQKIREECRDRKNKLDRDFSELKQKNYKLFTRE